MITQKIEIGGRIYTTEPRECGQACTGCVARWNEKLCEQLLTLCDERGRTIVVEVKEDQ